jgi:hypothetical protein
MNKALCSNSEGWWALRQASEALLDLVAACATHGSSANPSGEVARVLEGLEYRRVRPSLRVFAAGMRAVAAGAFHDCLRQVGFAITAF